MTTVSISPPPILQFLDNAGRPAVGGSVLTQVGGINTATYQDAAGTIPLPNPIPLNSRGEISNAAGVSCQLFLAAAVIYTFTLFDAAGNQLNQATAVSSGGAVTLTALAASGGSSLVGFIQAGTGAVTRTAQDKMRERVNPKDFGAVGDGVTDDRAAMVLAIAAVPSGGALDLGNEAYFIGSPGLTITRSSITIRADSDGAGLIMNGNYPLITIDSTGGAVVDLNFIGIGMTSQVNAGHGTSAFSTGIQLAGANGWSRSRVEDCRFSGFYRGIYNPAGSSFMSYVQIHGNRFDNNGGQDHHQAIADVGTNGSGVEICGNEVIIQSAAGGVLPYGVFCQGAPIGDRMISGNDFNSGVDFTGIYLDATVAPTYGKRYIVVGNRIDGSLIMTQYIYIRGITLSRFLGNITNAGSQVGIAVDTGCANNVYDDGIVFQFTGTLTGCTTAPQGTIRYTRTGRLVTLQVPTLSATSNATTMTITGLPAELIPAQNQDSIARSEDNGAALAPCLVRVDTGGVINFFKDLSGSGFTAAGTKAVGSTTITYIIS